MKSKHGEKLPIVIERYKNDQVLRDLDETK